MDKNTSSSDNNNRPNGEKPDGGANQADGTPSAAETTVIMDAVYPHLLAETAELIDLPIDERVNHIQSDRIILHEDTKILLVRFPPQATQPAIALALARELGLASYNGLSRGTTNFPSHTGQNGIFAGGEKYFTQQNWRDGR
jgi:hypothetical protein